MRVRVISCLIMVFILSGCGEKYEAQPVGIFGLPGLAERLVAEDLEAILGKLNNAFEECL